MGYRLLLSLLLSCMPVQLWAEPVRLTTLEWPPYTSQSLPDGGLTGHIVKRAFAEAGLEVTFDFYPWQRAVRLAADPTQPYSGYFPEYLSDTLPTLWRSSPSVGDSVLGMAQRSGSPIPWQQLTDLAPYRIGVVEGYVNTREFDALMASKRLNTAAEQRRIAISPEDPRTQEPAHHVSPRSAGVATTGGAGHCQIGYCQAERGLSAPLSAASPCGQVSRPAEVSPCWQK